MNNETFSTETNQLTGAWKCLFNANYAFEKSNGADHKTAELLALRSIDRKKGLSKKLMASEYGH